MDNEVKCGFCQRLVWESDLKQVKLRGEKRRYCDRCADLIPQGKPKDRKIAR